MLKKSLKLLPQVKGLPCLQQVRFQSDAIVVRAEDHEPYPPIGARKDIDTSQLNLAITEGKREVIPDWDVRGEFHRWPVVQEKTWSPAPLAPIGGLKPLPEELGNMDGYHPLYELKKDPTGGPSMYHSYIFKSPSELESFMWAFGLTGAWSIFCTLWHYNL